eukprot:510922_1
MKLVCKDFNTKLLDRILEYHKNKPNKPIQNKCESDNDYNTTDDAFESDDMSIENHPNILNHNHNDDESKGDDLSIKNHPNILNHNEKDDKTVTDYVTDEDCDIDMINNDHNHNCNDESNSDDLSIGNHPNIHNNNLLFSDDSVGDADDEMEDEDVPQTLTDAMYKSYLIKTFNQKK